MKKFTKILATCLLVVMVCLTFASCKFFDKINPYNYVEIIGLSDLENELCKVNRKKEFMDFYRLITDTQKEYTIDNVSIDDIVEEEIVKELYGFTASPKKYMSAVSNQSSDGFHDDVFIAFEFHDEQEADDQYDYLMKYLRAQTNLTDVIYDHGKIGCILYFGSGDGVVDALPY